MNDTDERQRSKDLFNKSLGSFGKRSASDQVSKRRKAEVAASKPHRKKPGIGKKTAHIGFRCPQRVKSIAEEIQAQLGAKTISDAIIRAVVRYGTDLDVKGSAELWQILEETRTRADAE